MDEAGPSIAVQMVGLNGVPTAGDDFAVCASEQEVEHNTSLSLQLPIMHPPIGHHNHTPWPLDASRSRKCCLCAFHMVSPSGYSLRVLHGVFVAFVQDLNDSAFCRTYIFTVSALR